MDAVTNGPIPSEMMLPKEAPKMIDKNSNSLQRIFPRPYKGTNPITKNKTRIIKVHFNFSLNERRCFGPFTSGRWEIRVSRKDIFIPIFAFSEEASSAEEITSPPAAFIFPLHLRRRILPLILISTMFFRCLIIYCIPML